MGTIAAGVAKAHADVVLISGYDGGTGASPVSSIKHAGLPWELGVAETHQTLVLNNLRDRIVIETDGQLKTGRDVVIAALLGAEEFGFATAPLVTLGCVMMRVCHLDTCPVGVATQNPELRKNFTGDPQSVVNFMRFIAQEMRELMAHLGFRTIDEMVGRADRLQPREAIEHWKARGLDFSEILYQPDLEDEEPQPKTSQDHGLEDTLDNRLLLELCRPALEQGQPVSARPAHPQRQSRGRDHGRERDYPPLWSRRPARGYDPAALHGVGRAELWRVHPQGDDAGARGRLQRLSRQGSLRREDRVVSAGRLDVRGRRQRHHRERGVLRRRRAARPIIRGKAGERFCVRNSGIDAVVEGVGDHGCEYMTGGRVVVLGQTGRNFAAGMSGGIAYVFDEKGDFDQHCNQDMVTLRTLADPAEIAAVKAMIQRHAEFTGSAPASRLLAAWDDAVPRFVRVVPNDYERMMAAFREVEAEGLTGEEAVMAAFELNKNDRARVSGN